MENINEDTIINVVHKGIKESIRVVLKNKCYGAAVILILSGIDSMAYLDMPESQEDVNRNDFINWAEKYIKFPCKEQLTGLELYGARCGMLHNYSSRSKLSREGRCRQISYMNKSIPEIRYDLNISKDLVMVSIEGLANAFFDGIDKFLIALFSNKIKGKIAEKRFKWLMHTTPYKQNKNNS